jgi:O-acetyl-ADP-ribose deacetylase (regulator of RNase III)
MSIELTIPGLFLSDYSDRIKINEKYNTETGVILSEYGKNRIVDSLLHTLSIEEGLYDRNQIPDDNKGKRNLLRALLNIRPPSQIKNSFLTKIDQLLQYELRHKIIVTCNNICSASVKFSPADIKNGNILFLWKGDITCLKVDAIVNAANDKMLGCFQPLHNCIDNVIHSAAGPLLREDCKIIMDIQNSREQTGDAKITRAYNLPSRYVLHTVGPIIMGKEVSEFQQKQLASCYKSCLSLAAQIEEIKSIAFPCISTGVFNFPHGLAAEIAVHTVDEWLEKNSHQFSHIIFNVFIDEDFSCYARTFC